MNEVRNGEQKEQKYLCFEMFYGGQKLHNYFPSLLIKDTSLLRPFLTRKFFQEILGLEGSKISWEKKHVSYEEIFRQNFLAQNFLRKFWLGFS